MSQKASFPIHPVIYTDEFKKWLDNTASVDLLKMVPVEILPNFGNYFRTLQLGF